jgi:uroporphyrin-III C-methyltransferase/precorrin-2 dehydrogenase/sirohydrochlorin ferrochelatase
MDQLPIFFNVNNRWVAVLGGGVAAARKAEIAMRAGAQVKVFAAQLCEEFEEIKESERFRFVPREPLAQDLDGCALLYCASENTEQNRKLHAIAQEARIPCNVVDMPELCDFTMPSIVDRSPFPPPAPRRSSVV